MLLNDFLKKYKIHTSKLADDAGLSRSALYKITGGVHKPTPKNAARIEKATDGVVTRLELLFPENYTDTEGGG